MPFFIDFKRIHPISVWPDKNDQVHPHCKMNEVFSGVEWKAGNFKKSFPVNLDL